MSPIFLCVPSCPLWLAAFLSPRHALRLHLFRGALHCLHNVLVTRAAAYIAFQAMPDLFIRGIRIALQDLCRSHDHPRRAESALQPMMLPESALHRMQLAALGQPLDGGHG